MCYNYDVIFAGVSDKVNKTELTTISGSESKVLSLENYNEVPLYTDIIIEFIITEGTYNMWLHNHGYDLIVL